MTVLLHLMSEKGTATLREKNQITVPPEAVKTLGIEVGDLLLFEPTEHGVIIKKARIVPAENARTSVEAPA